MGLSAPPLLMPLLYGGKILDYGFIRELLRDSYLYFKKYFTYESGNTKVLSDIMLHNKSSKLKAWWRGTKFPSLNLKCFF